MPIKNEATVELNGESIEVQMQELGYIETVNVEVPPHKNWKPLGYCMYCGSTEDLSDEHIIPLGLSGEHVLPRSSCVKCARETSRFEQLVLRGPMSAARVFRRLRSRSKHKNAPATHRLRLVKEAGEEDIDLPLAEYPILLHFPIFAQPGCFTGDATLGIKLSGVNTINFGPHPAAVAKALGARELRFPAAPQQPTAFARLIAKIGYGYAFALGHIQDVYEPSSVLPAIRGLRDDVGQWVFTDTSVVRKYPGMLHRAVMHRLNDHLVAEVQLFADSETPTYGVVLGRLKPR